MGIRVATTFEKTKILMKQIENLSISQAGLLFH